MDRAAKLMLGHGLGGDGLPIDPIALTWGAGVLIIASFVAFGVLWRNPALEQAAVGVLVKPQPARLLNVLSTAARVLGMVIYLITLAAAFTGSSFGVLNVTPWVILIAIGVVVPFVSFVFGDVWRAANPIRTMALAAAALGRTYGLTSPRAISDWPAAFTLAGFFWFDLAYHSPASPRVLGWLMVFYTLFVVVPTARLGIEWAERADGIAWWFSLIASMAPLHKTESGLRLRWPTVGAVSVDVRPGSVLAILIVIGATTYDGVTRTGIWGDVIGDRFGWSATSYATLGYIWSIALVTLLYSGAARWADRTLAGARRSSEHFMPSLIPVAFGYLVAHSFSSLIFDTQTLFIRASDPFGDGSNWFGTAGWRENTRAVSSAVIAWFQIGAIVGAHTIATMIAHDRAILMTDDHEAAVRSQYVMVLAMVAFTGAGLALLIDG